jgi:hypothetical protein
MHSTIPFEIISVHLSYLNKGKLNLENARYNSIRNYFCPLVLPKEKKLNFRVRGALSYENIYVHFSHHNREYLNLENARYNSIRNYFCLLVLPKQREIK